MPVYSIPEVISNTSKCTKFSCHTPIESKIIFLEPTNEQFFFSFPKAWESVIEANFQKIYDDGKNKYSFTFSIFDGNKTSSYSSTMLGLEFKNYLIGLLKFAKTLSILVTHGSKVSNYIICKA